jgi:hypothetical protein
MVSRCYNDNETEGGGVQYNQKLYKYWVLWGETGKVYIFFHKKIKKLNLTICIWKVAVLNFGKNTEKFYRCLDATY